MLVRSDVARKYGYKSSGGDEHSPLLAGISEEGGGLLRELGVWSSYCYTWGCGNWHISGSLGAGTVEDRTRAWMTANVDLSSPQIAPCDLSEVWSRWSLFCGSDRQSWFQTARGEPVANVIEVPKSQQLLELVGRCFPEQVWRTLSVLEFGRLRNTDPEKLAADGGSTLQLATDERIRKVVSVDPDKGTEEACRQVIPEAAIGKVKFLARIEDCPACSLGAYFHLLLIDADDDPLQNLYLLGRAMPLIRPDAVIAVDDYSIGAKHLLIREVLRPTHFETVIGDLLVFVRRPDPEELRFPIRLDCKAPATPETVEALPDA